MASIKYRLTVYVDGEKVYRDTFDTSNEVQDALNDADLAVEKQLEINTAYPRGAEIGF